MQLTLNLVTASGAVVQAFEVPKHKNITKEQAAEMGKTIADSINNLGPQLEAYERELEKKCTCFWIKQTPEERSVLRHHSSACPVQEME